MTAEGIGGGAQTFDDLFRYFTHRKIGGQSRHMLSAERTLSLLLEGILCTGEAQDLVATRQSPGTARLRHFRQSESGGKERKCLRQRCHSTGGVLTHPS